MNGFDALEWGAKHVTFTDVRQQTFEDYISWKPLPDGDYEWKYLDFNEISEHIQDYQNIDIIIYHGHFYHASNHAEIIQAFSKTSAKHIIFETKCEDSNIPDIRWHCENTIDIWNAFGDQEFVEVGSPNTAACDQLFKDNGYIKADSVKQEWRATEDFPPLCQYRAHFVRIDK